MEKQYWHITKPFTGGIEHIAYAYGTKQDVAEKYDVGFKVRMQPMDIDFLDTIDSRLTFFNETDSVKNTIRRIS